MRIDIKIAQYGIRFLNRHLRNYERETEENKNDEWNALLKEDSKYQISLTSSLPKFYD